MSCSSLSLDHSHHWDKAFHFPGKFHFLVKIITDSVRLGVVYLNLVLSTANEALLFEVCLQPAAHIFTTIQDLFILLSSFSKNRSSIPDLRFWIPDPWSTISSKPRRLISNARTKTMEACLFLVFYWVVHHFSGRWQRFFWRVLFVAYYR